MDPLSALKSDVFRPVATIVVPGITVLAPLVFVTIHYNPAVETFWHDQPVAFVLLFAVAVLAAGLILENFGSQIETLWDRHIEARTKVQTKDWEAYLGIKLDRDSVGQHYLSSILLRMKFELSFGLAIIICWLGCLWWQSLTAHWRTDRFAIASVTAIAFGSYLLWESYSSAWILARTRHGLVSWEAFPATTTPAASASAWFRTVCWIDSALAAAIGLFLVIYPAIPIFLSPYQTSDSQQALTRVLGVASLGYAGLVSYFARLEKVERAHLLGATLLGLHLAAVAALLLARGEWCATALPVACLVIQALRIVAYLQVALKGA